MNDLPMEDTPPNVQHCHRVDNGQLLQRFDNGQPLQRADNGQPLPEEQLFPLTVILNSISVPSQTFLLCYPNPLHLLQIPSLDSPSKMTIYLKDTFKRPVNPNLQLPREFPNLYLPTTS